MTVYRGEDAVEHFLVNILKLAEDHQRSMTKPLVMTKEAWEAFNRVANCYICGKELGTDRVRDRHISGN